MTTSKRQVTSHADHAHENTSKARSACRAALAKGEPIELKPEKEQKVKPAPAKKAPAKKATAAA